MGLRNFLKKILGRNDNQYNQYGQTNNPNNNQNYRGIANNYDLNLNYKSGDNMLVKFNELECIQLEDGTQRYLQKVSMMCTSKDGSFKNYYKYIDPVDLNGNFLYEMDQNGNYKIDQYGNYMVSAKSYFTNIASNNLSLVKGFFRKDDMEHNENGYIGCIGYASNGNYIRKTDSGTNKYFNEKLYEKQCVEAKKSEENNKKFLEELNEKATRLDEPYGNYGNSGVPLIKDTRNNPNEYYL